MTELAAAAVVFFLLHRGIAGTRLRELIVARIGTKAFRAIFAVATLVVLTWLWTAYMYVRSIDVPSPFYAVPDALFPIQWLLQFLAILLIVCGVSTRNPTIVGGGKVVREQNVVRGVLRVTRHPFMWGVCVLAAGHMMFVPTPASWIFFGTLLLVASTGTRSIDAKRRRAQGADWDRFAAQTSNIPFAAIIAGRQSLSLGELGFWRLLAVVAVFAALVLLHPVLFAAHAVPAIGMVS